MAILWIDAEYPLKPDVSRPAADDGLGRELFAAISRARGTLPETRAAGRRWTGSILMAFRPGSQTRKRSAF
jgi:hypothetical protein